jgi:hypothetical protein
MRPLVIQVIRGNRSGRDEHFLVCEIRPDPGNKTYQGDVQINYVSWSLTKVGQEMEIRYERTNATINAASPKHW